MAERKRIFEDQLPQKNNDWVAGETEEPEEDEESTEQDKQAPSGAQDKIGLDLLRHGRTIIISEEVSDRLTRRLIPQLLWLDWDSNDPIRLFINTPGGSADQNAQPTTAIRVAVCNIETSFTVGLRRNRL